MLLRACGLVPSCSKLVSPLSSVFASIASQSGQGSKSLMLRWSSNNSSAGKAGERPHMFQLDHIQKRLEYTTPLMFRMMLDYTFYTPDFVLEDQIWNVKRVGIDAVTKHMAILSVAGRVCCPWYIRAEPVSINKVLEDGTVRLRWRIHYVSLLDLISNPRYFRTKYLENNLRWYDGYSVFFVDGEGLVYRATLQRIMPDQPTPLRSVMPSKKQKIAEKIGVFPGAASFMPSESEALNLKNRKNE